VAIAQQRVIDGAAAEVDDETKLLLDKLVEATSIQQRNGEFREMLNSILHACIACTTQYPGVIANDAFRGFLNMTDLVASRPKEERTTQTMQQLVQEFVKHANTQKVCVGLLQTRETRWFFECRYAEISKMRKNRTSEQLNVLFFRQIMIAGVFFVHLNEEIRLEPYVVNSPKNQAISEFKKYLVSFLITAQIEDAAACHQAEQERQKEELKRHEAEREVLAMDVIDNANKKKEQQKQSKKKKKKKQNKTNLNVARGGGAAIKPAAISSIDNAIIEKNQQKQNKNNTNSTMSGVAIGSSAASKPAAIDDTLSNNVPQKKTIKGEHCQENDNAGLATIPPQDPDESLCVVCISNRKTVVLLPCRHMCVCPDCVQAILQVEPACPLCRAQVEDTIKVFV
jgi:hypothetical protein